MLTLGNNNGNLDGRPRLLKNSLQKNNEDCYIVNGKKYRRCIGGNESVGHKM